MRRELFAHQSLYLWGFLLPAVGYLVIWRFGPALYTAYLSLTEYNLAFDAAPRWAGAANYARVIRDGELGLAVLRALGFAATVTTIELLLGLGAAIVLDRELPARNAILGISFAPMVVAPVAVATVWYVLFNHFVGPIPHIITALGGPTILWSSQGSTAFVTLAVADVWQWTPLMTLLLLAALQSVPRDTVEAAMVDGASGPGVFRFIVLPHITPAIVLAVALRFMDAFFELDKVLIMTGGGPGTATELVAAHVYKNAFKFFELGYASAIVMALLVGLAVFYALSLRAVRSRMEASAT